MNKEVVIIWDLSESSGGTFAATAHVEARFSCYFHILFTSRTLQISHVKASFLRKIFARFPNAKKKKENQSPLARNYKTFLVFSQQPTWVISPVN